MMRCRRAVSLAVLCVGLTVTGFGKAAAQEVKASDYFAAKEYAQTVDFPGGVTMRTVTYSTLPGYRPLKMDVYVPPGGATHPGLIFFHGGSWVGGNRRGDSPFGDFPGLLAAIAAHGYVVASADYRLSGEAHFPAPLMDVKTAIATLRAHARDYDLDPSRIASWGASAGGYLAVMAGLTCGVASLEPPGGNSGGSDCVQAVVDWSGFLVLDRMFADLGKPAPAKSPEGAFLGCEPGACPAAMLKASNPMTYVSGKSPPFLIQHGAADAILAEKQPRDLYDALRARNVSAQFVVYPGVGHMFMVPGKHGAAAGDAREDQAVLDAMLRFLDTTFQAKK